MWKTTFVRLVGIEPTDLTKVSMTTKVKARP
jgi:hypothetical protein